MKNIKGKIISIFMTFIMLVSILGINVGNVFADESSNNINVNIAVVGMYNENLFSPQQIKVSENATAEDVLKATGLNVEVKDNGMVDSIAGQKNGTDDGNYGTQSGWMYKVNYTTPQDYPKTQSVKDGDHILFVYIKNYGDLLPSYDSIQNDFVNVTVKSIQKDNSFSEQFTVLKNNSINAAIMEGLKKHGGDFDKSSLASEALMSKDDEQFWSYTLNNDKSTYNQKDIQLKDGDVITTFKDDRQGIKEGSVSVTGVNLDKTKSTLAEGDTVQLTATIAPDNATNKDLKWSSSDETIATVDTTGKVTAVKEGTATITVATEDGEKTSTCIVDVTKKQVLPTDNTFTMLITRDNGASTIKTFTMTIDKDKKNENSMDYLKSVTKVTELQGPGFINGIDGLLNVFLKDMPIEDRKAGYYGVDWFIYLNGSLTPVGATGVYPKAGDILNFDYHKWDWHSLVPPGTKTMPLKIENVPYSSIDSGTPIKLRVTCVFRGVYNVSVKVDGKEVATTDIDGYATITINEVGEHTIRVEKDDAYKEKKTTVKAAENKVVAINLNKTESTLTEGEILQLTAEVQPDNATNKNVTWKSSDETIAKVDENGKVTALKKGTATITVTSVDGQKTASCNVIINEKNQEKVSVTGVTLDKTNENVSIGGVLQLTATIVPDNATNKNVKWSSSDETIATVDTTGKVTAVKEGTATITVTTEDGEKTATCNVTVAKVEKKDYTKTINNLIDGISSTVTIDNCDDWLALGLNKVGKNVPEGYLSKLEQRVKAATKNGVLDLGNPTEYERLTLAVLACGGDPTNIAGQNLIEKIYNNNNMSDQGINAYVFGLIALQAGNFNIPNNAVWTKEKLINKILSYQEDDGWSYGGGSADPDMTAMAISALAPYYSTNTDVKSAIDIAINRLSQIQDANDGGFASYKTKNSESCSQVIIGLCANGIDPTTDDRFTKNGKNPMDALLTFATGDNKGFGHADNNINAMGTEQGLEALAAYKLFKLGKGSIYSGFTIKDPDSKTMKITNMTTKSEFSLGDDAKISIKIENNTNKDQDASLVLALYDQNGEFVDYVCGNQTIKKGDSSILTSMLKLPSQGVYTLKGFVWDTLEAMNPLSDVIEIHVK